VTIGWGFRWRGSNFPLSHWLWSSPLQHSRTTVRLCDFHNAQALNIRDGSWIGKCCYLMTTWNSSDFGSRAMCWLCDIFRRWCRSVIYSFRYIVTSLHIVTLKLIDKARACFCWTVHPESLRNIACYLSKVAMSVFVANVVILFEFQKTIDSVECCLALYLYPTFSRLNGTPTCDRSKTANVSSITL